MASNWKLPYIFLLFLQTFTGLCGFCLSQSQRHPLVLCALPSFRSLPASLYYFSNQSLNSWQLILLTLTHPHSSQADILHACFSPWLRRKHIEEKWLQVFPEMSPDFPSWDHLGLSQVTMVEQDIGSSGYLVGPGRSCYAAGTFAASEGTLLWGRPWPAEQSLLSPTSPWCSELPFAEESRLEFLCRTWCSPVHHRQLSRMPHSMCYSEACNLTFPAWCDSLHQHNPPEISQPGIISIVITLTPSQFAVQQEERFWNLSIQPLYLGK